MIKNNVMVTFQRKNMPQAKNNPSFTSQYGKDVFDSFVRRIKAIERTHDQWESSDNPRNKNYLKSPKTNPILGFFNVISDICSLAEFNFSNEQLAQNLNTPIKSLLDSFITNRKKGYEQLPDAMNYNQLANEDYQARNEFNKNPDKLDIEDLVYLGAARTIALQCIKDIAEKQINETNKS